MQPSNDVRIASGAHSSEAHRRHSRRRRRLTQGTLALSLLAALAVASTTLVGASAPARPSAMPSVGDDYCVVVSPVYVDDRQVFGGGTYCIPFPGA